MNAKMSRPHAHTIASLFKLPSVAWLFPPMQIRRNQIRKGMVLVHSSLNPVACWEFEGDILVLHHPTTISTKYQAMGM